jgi:hypothetical protein
MARLLLGRGNDRLLDMSGSRPHRQPDALDEASRAARAPLMWPAYLGTQGRKALMNAVVSSPP